jgi:hypothetical protein
MRSRSVEIGQKSIKANDTYKKVLNLAEQAELSRLINLLPHIIQNHEIAEKAKKLQADTAEQKKWDEMPQLTRVWSLPESEDTLAAGEKRAPRARSPAKGFDGRSVFSSSSSSSSSE